MACFWMENLSEHRMRPMGTGNPSELAVVSAKPPVPKIGNLTYTCRAKIGHLTAVPAQKTKRNMSRSLKGNGKSWLGSSPQCLRAGWYGCLLTSTFCISFSSLTHEGQTGQGTCSGTESTSEQAVIPASPPSHRITAGKDVGKHR